MQRALFKSSRRKRNPLAKGHHARMQLVQHLRTAKPYFCISALKFGKRTWATRDNKFSSRVAAARRFASKVDALKRARALLHYYPHLKSYKVAIHKGY